MNWKSSTTDPSDSWPRELPEWILVGQVRKPHGIRGALLIAVESDVPERFAPGAQLHLTTQSGERQRVVVAEAHAHGDGVLRLRLEGFERREEVEGLRGARLEVERREVPTAPPGTYYYFELEGCRCRDAREGDLGVVVDVLEDGGGWILRLRRESGEETLVPLVQSFLTEVDLEGGQIQLDLPEGLVAACTSKS